MAFPHSTRGWKINGTAAEDGSSALAWKEGLFLPEIGPTDVLIMFHAWSINYPDIAICNGTYPRVQESPHIVPGIDGAGEVLAVGSNVSLLNRGDRVVPLFYPRFDHGIAPTPKQMKGVPGIHIDGTFREHAVFDQHALIRIPKNLTYEEGATLSCSALTAWNALYGHAPLKPGDYVLVQGTGGVSMWAMKFAVAAGATVIATTSSDEKASILRDMGVQHIINYRNDPNWGETAKSLTPGHLGCAHVIEIGGPATIRQSFGCVARGGVIDVIGFLLGQENVPDSPTFLEPLLRVCTVRGVEVGSRQQFEEMKRAIEAKDIKPMLDGQKFRLEELREVYKHVWSRKHFGKVVISR